MLSRFLPIRALLKNVQELFIAFFDVPCLVRNGFFFRCMVESLYISDALILPIVPWPNIVLSLSETAQLYRDHPFVSFDEGAIVC